jgi:hypothetical protein
VRGMGGVAASGWRPARTRETRALPFYFGVRRGFAHATGEHMVKRHKCRGPGGMSVQYSVFSFQYSVLGVGIFLKS